MQTQARRRDAAGTGTRDACRHTGTGILSQDSSDAATPHSDLTRSVRSTLQSAAIVVLSRRERFRIGALPTCWNVVRRVKFCRFASTSRTTDAKKETLFLLQRQACRRSQLVGTRRLKVLALSALLPTRTQQARRRQTTRDDYGFVVTFLYFCNFFMSVFVTSRRVRRVFAARNNLRSALICRSTALFPGSRRRALGIPAADLRATGDNKAAV